MHGTRSTYTHGCRCTPCKAANAAYSRQRTLALAKGQWPHPSPVQPVLAHLQHLQRHGLGTRHIATLAKVARITLWRIQHGTVARLTARTAHAILSVTPQLAPHALINGYSTRRQIRSLEDEGYPREQLALRLGLHPRTLSRHATPVAVNDHGRPVRARQTTADTARKVRQLYLLLTAEESGPGVLSAGDFS